MIFQKSSSSRQLSHNNYNINCYNKNVKVNNDIHNDEQDEIQNVIYPKCVESPPLDNFNNQYNNSVFGSQINMYNENDDLQKLIKEINDQKALRKHYDQEAKNIEHRISIFVNQEKAVSKIKKLT